MVIIVSSNGVYYNEMYKQMKLTIFSNQAIHVKNVRQPTLATRPSPEYECGKRNPLYPILAASIALIVMNKTCTLMML